MSIVTGILISVSCADEENLRSLNVELAKVNDGRKLIEGLDEHMCTGKHPQISVAGGGMNYFSSEARQWLVDEVMTRSWEHPGEVVLLLYPEYGPVDVIRPQEPERGWAADY